MPQFAEIFSTLDAKLPLQPKLRSVSALLSGKTPSLIEPLIMFFLEWLSEESYRHGSCRFWQLRRRLSKGNYEYYSDVLLINVRTFIVARLLFATILLCLGFWSFSGVPRGILNSCRIFSAFQYCFIFFGFYPEKKMPCACLHTIMVDLIWESVLVHFSGGVDSVFIVFYVITILGSSSCFRLKAVLTTILTCVIFLYFNRLWVREC